MAVVRPKITSATNFTDESNPTITFTNTTGRKIGLSIFIENSAGENIDVVYNSPDFYTSPYTFDISEYSRNVVREAFPDKKQVTVCIAITDTLDYELIYTNKTMTFVNAEPEFTTINGYDADSSIVNVTGDNNILLMGKSNFAIDWTPAVGKKYATIKSYTVEWQDQSKTYTASASHPVSDFVLASSGTSLLRITATDSRGFTTTVEKELDVIEYVPPIAVVTIGRINNYEDETKFKIDASYTSVMAGDVEKNSITCKYRYKQNSETAVWSEWTEVANNEEITILFPKENEYLIQYTATDAFGEVWSGEYKLNKGKFPMFIDTELNAVGINDFPREGEALRVAGGSLVVDGLINGIDFHDSGWIDATLTSNFITYSSDTVPKYRKIGKMVEVLGAVKCTSAIAGSTTQYPIFTLPDGYRPSNTAIVTICQGSGTNIWTLRINTNGVVSFERYRSGTSYAATSTTAWLPFQVTFFID